VFPQFIGCIIRDETIVVVAVGRGHRKPGYWKSRLEA